MTVASLAVATLRELAVLAKPTRVERDAAIQRFEYSFEAGGCSHPATMRA